MKLLIIISLSLISLNVFSAVEGEDKKTPCPYADQSKREEKVVAPVETDTVKEEAKNTSV